MDSFLTRLRIFSRRQCIRCLVTTLLILLVLMGLHHGIFVRDDEPSRVQIDNHISRRSRAPMAAPGAIAGLVLGCIFGLLAVFLIIFFTRRKQRRAEYEEEDGSPWAGRGRLDIEIGNFQSSPDAGPSPELHALPSLDVSESDAVSVSGGPGFFVGSFSGSYEYEYRGSPPTIAPEELWAPTERERDMVEVPKNNPAFHLPSFSMQSLPLEDGYWSQDGPSQTTEKDIAEEKISSSVPDDAFDEDNPASTSGICSEPSGGPSQSNNPPNPLDLAQPPPASLRSVSSSNISLAEETTKQALIHCPAPHCSITFTQQYKLKSSLPLSLPPSFQTNKSSHHLRYHQKPKQCLTCNKSFGTTKDLGRHINSTHTSTKQWHCPVQDCKHSRTGKGGFDRKDNWRRHARNAHKLTGEERSEDF